MNPQTVTIYMTQLHDVVRNARFQSAGGLETHVPASDRWLIGNMAGRSPFMPHDQDKAMGIMSDEEHKGAEQSWKYNKQLVLAMFYPSTSEPIRKAISTKATRDERHMTHTFSDDTGTSLELALNFGYDPGEYMAKHENRSNK